MKILCVQPTIPGVGHPFGVVSLSTRQHNANPVRLPHNIALLRGLALRSLDGASTGAGILLYNHAISLIGGLSEGNLDPPIGRLRAQQTGTTK